MPENNIQITPCPKGRSYKDRLEKETVVLFLVSNPKDTSKLHTEREYNAVQDKRLKYARGTRIAFRPDIQREKLLEVLTDEKPTVLHFSGHGEGSDGLVFMSAAGYTQKVTGDALAALLKSFADKIDCVVLNACHSKDQAQIITKYIPNVIGIDSAIADTKAIAFAEAFYLCLFTGDSYQEAFEKAIASVGVQDMGTGAQPILYRWAGMPTTEDTHIELPLPPVANSKKKWIAALLLLPVVALAVLWATGVFNTDKTQLADNNNIKDNPNTTVTPPVTVPDSIDTTKREPYRDPNPNPSLRTLQIGTVTWHINILSENVADGSWCYANNAENCDKYGRLYSYKAAAALCDKSDKRLATAEEWEAAIATKTQKDLGIHYAGARDLNGNYTGMGESGKYWTSTTAKGVRMVYMDFSKNGEHTQQSTQQGEGLLCRCVE